MVRSQIFLQTEPMKTSLEKTAKMTIGRLAKQIGVNIETIRYYQRIGLISEPPLPARGYRLYSQQTAERITFIKRAQQLGFSLKEIAELLQIGDGHCDDVREKAEIKQKKIEQQIKDLQTLHKTLGKLVVQCKRGKSRTCCPIVEALTGKRRKD